ncbi:Centromere protein V [Apiospora saccharicola]
MIGLKLLKLANTYRTDITAVHSLRGQPATESSTDRGPPYTFSCHCGSVKATLNVALKDQEVKEDNCSRCVRLKRLPEN